MEYYGEEDAMLSSAGDDVGPGIRRSCLVSFYSAHILQADDLRCQEMVRLSAAQAAQQCCQVYTSICLYPTGQHFFAALPSSCMGFGGQQIQPAHILSSPYLTISGCHVCALMRPSTSQSAQTHLTFDRPTHSMDAPAAVWHCTPFSAGYGLAVVYYSLSAQSNVPLTAWTSLAAASYPSSKLTAHFGKNDWALKKVSF